MQLCNASTANTPTTMRDAHTAVKLHLQLLRNTPTTMRDAPTVVTLYAYCNLPTAMRLMLICDANTAIT